jgi:hypothetical protein
VEPLIRCKAKIVWSPKLEMRLNIPADENRTTSNVRNVAKWGEADNLRILLLHWQFTFVLKVLLVLVQQSSPVAFFYPTHTAMKTGNCSR